MRSLVLCCWMAGFGMVCQAGQAAEDIGARHGAIPMHVNGIAIQAGTVMILQHADDARIHDELLASVDIVSTVPTTNGQWLIYVEGNTSPNQRGVSTLLPEANQDAGTAVDQNGKGRLQVSSLHYLRFLGNNAVAIGLINPAGPLDNSDIANNETSQFLATTLVNNPTIAFPDYTLGMVYFYKPDQNGLDLTFLLSSSHGLRDNPDKSYAELVDVSAAGKGLFAVAELDWKQSQHGWRGGVWLQTADNPYLDGSGNMASNYGVYLTADHYYGDYGVNLRVGLANPRVSQAAKFIGLALDRSLGNDHAGIGYTYTFVSADLGAGTGDRSQLEAYYRLGLANNLTVTPSFQRIQHSGFDTSGATVNSNVNIVSVRSSYTF